MLATRRVAPAAKRRGARPGRLDGRPDDAGGHRHPRPRPRAVRAGPPPRSARPGRPAGRRRVRLPRPGGRGRRALRGSPVAIAAVATAFPSGRASLAGQARRHRAGARRRRHRDRHGDRPRGVARRALRAGARRDRRRPRADRRPRPPQGHPGDRRAARLRRRPPRGLARPARGRGRREDLDGQDLPRRDAAGRAGAAAGRARLAPAHRRAARRQGGRRDPHRRATPSGTWWRSTRSPARSGSHPALFRFGASSLLDDLLRRRRGLGGG